MRLSFFRIVLFLILFLQSENLLSVETITRKGEVYNPPEFLKYLYVSPKENFKLYFAGYIQEDFMSFQNAPQLSGHTNFREGVIELGFDLYDWNVDGSYNAASGRLLNAILTYKGSPRWVVIAGQFTPTMGLENNTTTAYLTFMELALPLEDMTPDYLTGIGVNYFTETLGLFASVFGPRIGTEVQGRTPFGATLAAVYSPIHTDRRVLHLGLSVWEQEVDSSHVINNAPIPEIFAGNEGSLVGENIFNVNNFEVIDGSMAVVLGPVEIEGEYLYDFVHRNSHLSTLEFWGYYLTASYFLTGESRRYDFKSSGFVGITPIKGPYGAWQIAVRYSNIDLNSQNVLGGKERNISVGLNWFPTFTIKCYLDYIHAFANPNSDGINQSSNFYGLRFQWVF